MICFSMIHDDGIDALEIDFLLEVLYEIKPMWNPNRIDENGLFLFDEIRILAGAVVDGIIISMEMFELPVEVSDPTDIALYMSFHPYVLPLTPIASRHGEIAGGPL